MPRNFFYANPDALGGANVTGNGGYTKYNGLQLQFRRRLSGGLQMDANYAMGMAWESSRYSFRVPRKLTRNTGGEGDVRQALKATFVYELPIGQGRRFANGAGPVLDRIIGGWQISGTMRVQTGELIDLGNIRANGMSIKEVEKAFSLRRLGPNVIYMWPDDIMENTIKAYSRDLIGYTQGTPTGRYFSPANGPDCIETIAAGYGDCGLRTLVIMGPIFRTMDLNIVKDVRIAGRKSVQFRIDALNVFDAVNFNPTTGIGRRRSPATRSPARPRAAWSSSSHDSTGKTGANRTHKGVGLTAGALFLSKSFQHEGHEGRLIRGSGNCMLQGHEATRCKAATFVTSGRPKPGGTGGRSPPAAEGRVPTASEPDDERQALSLG